MTRVAGVGIGVFIFFFFLAFCISLCLCGSRTKQPWISYWLSSIIFSIVFLVLFASPKGPQDEPPEGYDRTIIPMTIIMTLMCVGIAWGFLGMLIWVVFPMKYARPLRYDVDVLQGD